MLRERLKSRIRLNFWDKMVATKLSRKSRPDRTIISFIQHLSSQLFQFYESLSQKDLAFFALDFRTPTFYDLGSSSLQKLELYEHAFKPCKHPRKAAVVRKRKLNRGALVPFSKCCCVVYTKYSLEMLAQHWLRVALLRTTSPAPTTNSQL